MAKRRFELDEIVTIKSSNVSDLTDLYYGKIKKIHDDNIHYDVDMVTTNKMRRGLHVDRIEKVALIQYVAFIREKGIPPPRPGYLIQFAERNGIDVTYVDAKKVIDTKPDITIYKQLPRAPSIFMKSKQSSCVVKHAKEPTPYTIEQATDDVKESENANNAHLQVKYTETKAEDTAKESDEQKITHEPAKKIQPQSEQTELIMKLIYEAIEANRHKSPLLSTTLGIEGVFL